METIIVLTFSSIDGIMPWVLCRLEFSCCHRRTGGGRRSLAPSPWDILLRIPQKDAIFLNIRPPPRLLSFSKRLCMLMVIDVNIIFRSTLFCLNNFKRLKAVPFLLHMYVMLIFLFFQISQLCSEWIFYIARVLSVTGVDRDNLI